MALTEKEQSIIKALSYFDATSYPLTALELLAWVDFPAKLSELLWLLDSENLKRLITCENGFYCLSGRRKLVWLRQKRHLISCRKFKRALSVCRWLRRLPFIRAIAVYSSLSHHNADDQSDADLFIITAAGRVWSARFFGNLWLRIFRLRPGENRGDNKICVSFWADENQLDFDQLKNNSGSQHYLYGTARFIFVYNQKMGQKFFSDNRWIKSALPNWQFYRSVARRILPPENSTLKNILELIISPLSEAVLKKLQLKLLADKIKLLDGADHRVVLGDSVIKLHHKDRRETVDAAAEATFKKLTAYVNQA